MHVVGLDLSLTSTGIAAPEPETIRFHIVRDASPLDRVARLRDLGRLIDRVCKPADVVVMEGHSFNSKNTHAHSLGELHGVVKVCLFQRAKPFVIVAPAQLKRFAVGKGNASKDEVLARAAREHPGVSNNNEADAYFLRLMGLAHYEQHDFVLPEYRKAVLSAVTWPEIPVGREEVVGSG